MGTFGNLCMSVPRQIPHQHGGVATGRGDLAAIRRECCRIRATAMSCKSGPLASGAQVVDVDPPGNIPVRTATPAGKKAPVRRKGNAALRSGGNTGILAALGAG